MRLAVIAVVLAINFISQTLFQYKYYGDNEVITKILDKWYHYGGVSTTILMFYFFGKTLRNKIIVNLVHGAFLVAIIRLIFRFGAEVGWWNMQYKGEVFLVTLLITIIVLCISLVRYTQKFHSGFSFFLASFFRHIYCRVVAMWKQN